ncbi:MAG TPA: DUF6691 family protein, partial [Polyangiales bacterium]|nr:DUF6691 family protein [Polyangiales bacterium]
KLLFGAGVFGIGWGLGGYCPGPSLVSLAALSGGVIVFVSATALGMWIAGRLEQLRPTESQPSAAE